MSAIVVDGLTRRYGAFTAVDRVSFEVGVGEIFGYLGANGAGKSTTIRMLCGLIAPTEGDAVVAGHKLSTQPEKIKASIGYMSQKFSLYPELKVVDNLSFFGGAYGMWGRKLRARIDEALEQVDMRHELDAITGSLSGGLRQRVALAGAILHRPAIVFLDEPTAGVDPAARRRFWTLIRELASGGTTIFVTTHYMDEAEYCARVGLMVAGRLAALDTPAELEHQYAPGKVYVLRGVAADAAKRLRAVAGVLDVQSIGAGLRVRVAADAPDRTEALHDAAGPGTDIEADAANLEDVFLAVVDDAAQRAGTARAFEVA